MTANSFTLETDGVSLSTYTRTSPNDATRTQVKVEGPQGTKTLSLFELVQLVLSAENK